MIENKGTVPASYQNLLMVIIVAVALLIGAFFAITTPSFTPQGSENTGTNVGDAAPNFSLTTLSGENFTLQQKRGKIIIIDFMYIGCPGCKAEMSHLKEIHSDYSTESVEIISIDIYPPDTEEELETFKNDYEADWDFAKGSEVGTDYNVSMVPTICIIDPDGEIVYRKLGVISSSTISDEIENIL